MEEENKNPRKNWDFMIGIALVLFGSFRLYQRLQTESEWNYRVVLTVGLILYGGFLIYRHLKNKNTHED
ncbi:hypothetical protein [uncultured Aquimarina sp.]|uniref:hypothetical protein n=1 Tax=uncultured Aquimarina sp. TaxID=575652 RepID=UPI00261913E7|nr:hypothetical protein [uncultured Aquimarina sp.]